MNGLAYTNDICKFYDAINVLIVWGVDESLISDRIKLENDFWGFFVAFVGCYMGP